MKIQILTIGKLKKGAILDIFSEYRKRTTRWKIEIKEFPESRAQTSELRKKEEAQKLLSSIEDSTVIIALDERGDMLSSQQIAHFIQHKENESQNHLCFIIGGPDGLSASLRERANQLWALGKATWPHQIVRFLLMEQIYRSQTIIVGHPYHKD